MIAKFALSAKNYIFTFYSKCIAKFLDANIFGIIVTKCNQSMQVFSCMRNETGMKILVYGMHMQALCMYM